MSAFQHQSQQEHPFFVLSEASPDSHSPSNSPYFVRTLDAAPEQSLSSPHSSQLTQRDSKKDNGQDTSIAGVVISSLLGVVQIGLQAKGNNIALASLQLAQTIATTEHGHRAVVAVGAGGMSAVSALQQGAGAVCRSLSATLNPLGRDIPPQVDPQNGTDDGNSEANDVVDDRFAVGSECSEEEVETLDGIQMPEDNPWLEERGEHVVDNFQVTIPADGTM